MKTSFVGVAIAGCLIAGIVGCYLGGQPEAANTLVAILVGQLFPQPVGLHPGGSDK